MKLVWAGLGAVVTVAVLYQVGRARAAADSVAKTLTPEGLVEALSQGVDELRLVGRELRTAMREQEARLTADLLPPPEVVDDARTLRAGRPARAVGRGADYDPWDDADF
ncbi:hypothetical protein [Salana multivorans]